MLSCISFFSFTVSQDPDDSSEDELFSKQQPSKGSPSQSERIALLRLNRQSPLASKDVPEQGDNMCHNPGMQITVHVVGIRLGLHVFVSAINCSI